MLKRIAAIFLALALLVPGLAWADSGIVIPEMPIGEFEIPDNEAMAFLRRMGTGWNLGNTLEAYIDGQRRGVNDETSWGNPRTTPELFQAIADAGFGFVRIPVSWHTHVDADLNVDEAWMDRVQEVVDWALDAGLIVIINIHHDNAPAWYFPDSEHLDASLTYVTRIWAQIAERFADYDERLVFEGLNEPRLVGSPYEWSFNTAMLEIKDAADCLNRLNQAFVDTVRAAGGRNADRYLAVPGYAASPDGIDSDLFVLPTDSADNRIIVAAHAYSPYDFALNARGTDAFDPKRPADRSGVMLPIKKLYDRWISKGIPAYMGEWGTVDKGNPQARVDHAALFVSAATQWNIPVCWWDNGALHSNGENFRIINRRTLEWEFPELVETIMRYSLKETVPAQ